MIDVKIISRPKGGDSGSTSTTRIMPGTSENAQHADSASYAENAGYAEKAGYAENAGEAIHARTADALSDDSGVQLYQDEQGNWHFETDYIHANMKLTAKELQIEEVKHVGGQQLLTAASMSPDYIKEMPDCWRCYWKKVDSNGKTLHNKWQTGDLAYVSTFNLDSQATGVAGNHFLWRAVIQTSNEEADNSTIYIEETDDTISMSDYHYIDLSKTDCAEGSDAPLVGDDIVQLGNTTDTDRQNAIIVAGAGTESPYIRQFTGITDYHLPEPDTQIKPGDNLFTGRTTITGGTFPDGTDLTKWWEGLEHGDENMIENSGFTGNYESIETDEDTYMTPDTSVYSPQLDKWSVDGDVEVVSMESQSGYGVSVDGAISQDVGEMEGGQIYTLSFKAKGTSLTVALGDWSEEFPLTSELTYFRAYVALSSPSDAVVFFTGSFELCEPRLSRGNVASDDWAKNAKDGDEAKAVAQAANYVLAAIRNGNTTILGGLILSQMLKVGNYRDGEMSQETGGMSGLYTSDNSPFLWGGGDMDKAFYTISKYKNNPAYQATAEEIANMAKFVVTHGGRAILNDIVLRGYIYAEGGVFKNVQSPNGNWKIDENGDVTVDGTIKATGGLYFETEYVDTDYMGISDGVGFVVFQSSYDNLYMPENPVEGQQLIISNPSANAKTLRIAASRTNDRFMYWFAGTWQQTTFPIKAMETVTFVFTDDYWYLVARASMDYS